MEDENKCTSELFVEFTNNMIKEAKTYGLHSLEPEKILAIKECAQVVFSNPKLY